jgi:5-methylcytosine-specific restriction endonuclease McrA
MSDDAPTHKQCTKCGEIKPMLEFPKHKLTKDGYENSCNMCKAEKSRAWRAANVIAHRSYNRNYRASHLDEVRAKDRAYRRINSEKLKDYIRAWHVANREKTRESKRIAYAKNPYPRLAANQRYRARVKGNGGDFSAAELNAMRIEYAGVCAYCKGQHVVDDLTIDHVLPIEQGGRHEAANIVLACGICNSSKGNRTPEQWIDRWYERKNRAKK